MKNIFLSLIAALGITSACTAQETIHTVTPQEFARLTKTDSKAVILDVRTADEYAGGHLEQATNIDYLQEESCLQQLSALDTTNTYYIYCRSGRRSHNAAVKMQGMGLKVVDMEGGILAWTAQQLPVTLNLINNGILEEVFTTSSGKQVNIGLVKHGTLYIRHEGYQIHIDPVANYGRPTDYASMAPADLILVTHEHGDHLDATSIKQLSKPETVLYLNERSHQKIQQGEVLRNGDRRTVGHDILLEAVPAYNTTAERTQFHPRGVGNGYVLTIDGLRIYVAGDTEDIDEMSLLHDIDVAFLPANLPYTMTVEQAARAARTIHPRVLIPYHFGQTEIDQLRQLLSDTDIDVRIREMQ